MALIVTPSHVVPGTGRVVDASPKSLFSTPLPQTQNPPFPVLFYDQVTVNSGGEQAFRASFFTNNTGRPVEIHGLRIVVQMQAIAGGTAVTGRLRGGGIVALELEIDGKPVTRGAVPVWHLCRSDNRRSDTVAVNALTTYCWYFSQPVPLLPGRGMKVQAKHLGSTPQQAIVSVAFAGRTSPAPIPNRVPFAASWTSRSFAYAEVGLDSCPPDALVNDSGRDLTVDRIIGRSIAYDDSSLGAGVNQAELADYDDVSLQGVTSLFIRLGLSQSRPILKTYTSWRTVFGQNAALEEKFCLKDGDYFTADVAHIAGPALTTAFTFSQNRGSLSILGWREV